IIQPFSKREDFLDSAWVPSDSSITGLPVHMSVQDNHGVLLLQERDGLPAEDHEGSRIVAGVKVTCELMGECRFVVSIIFSCKTYEICETPNCEITKGKDQTVKLPIAVDVTTRSSCTEVVAPLGLLSQLVVNC
ncbi:Hypothetical predicted protein, partial [Paramuricea clavata]